MTVTSTTNRVNYSGSGSTGPFDYDFQIYAASDLLVTKVDSSGVETTLSYPVDYSVTGVGETAGGTVTLTTALETGEGLTIRRVLPLTQLINVRNQGATFPVTMERGFDQAVMRAQQLENDLQASVRLAETTDPSAFDTHLPANLSPGDAVVVNATGDGFSMAALTAAQLSAWYAANSLTLDRFTSGVDFTPGVSSTLTLSADPGTEDNCTVTARVSGTVRIFEHDEYSVSGTTLTFGSVIPAGATYIEVGYLLTYQVNVMAAQNVSYTALVGSGATNVRDDLRFLDNRVNSLWISVQDTAYGAVGNGVHDDTAAIQAAADAVDAAGGGVLYFPPGTYLISSHITITRLVSVLGCGSGASILKANAEKQLRITGGGGADLYTKPLIQAMGFDTVQVRYGNANTDYGTGCTLRDCDSTGCSIAVYYGYNCWLTLIDNCHLHDCTTGIHFDLATAGSNTGASMVIRGGAIFNCTTCFHVDGNTSDGHDIKVIGTDLEHATGKAVRYEPDGNGLLCLDDIHMELNDDTYISQTGGNLVIRGLWALPAGTTYNQFYLANAASGGVETRCWISDSWINWDATKFAKLVEADAYLFLDSDSILSNATWFGEGSATIVTATSTAGHVMNGGMGIGARAAKVLTAQHNVDVGSLAPGAGSAVTVCTFRAFDAAPRTIEFDVTVASVAGVNTNTLQILLNPGGTINLDLPFLNAAGGAHVRVTYTPGGDINATALYAPTIAGNSAWVHDTNTDSNGHTVERFLTLVSLDTAPNGATMAISNLVEYVH